jgi:hypothetical protein
MPLRRLLLGIIAVVAAIAGGILVFPVDKTAAVTRLLDDGEAAIEHADLDRIDKLISLYYKDDLGFTYASMRGNFSYVFKQYENITISRTTDAIVIGKDSCIARVTLWIRGNWLGNTSDILGTETAYEPVDIYCVRELFRWKVIGTHWPNNGAGIPSVLERQM